MKYCEDAQKLLKINVVCGGGCPIVKRCPRLILEDITDEAVERLIKILLETMSEKE